MDGAAVIAAYHDLWHVEQSFRMTKTDPRARPVFHHQRQAIEAHLTVVTAALAVARHLQDATGTSIKKIIQILRTARSATIEINGQRLTLDPDLTDAARGILQRLESGHYAIGTSQVTVSRYTALVILFTRNRAPLPSGRRAGGAG
jgi:hypothetical protein